MAPLGDFAQQVADIRADFRNSSSFAEVAVGDQIGIRICRFFASAFRPPLEKGARKNFRFGSRFPSLFWLHQLRSLGEGY